MTDPDAKAAHFALIPRPEVDVFGGEGSLMAALSKAERLGGGTNVGSLVGSRPPLVDKDMARRFRDLNTTHATCCESKRGSSVGMGHRDEGIYEVLDPLCRFGWQDLLDSVGDDLIDTGEGFIECVWDEGRTVILGLNPLDSAGVSVVVEEEGDSEAIHYQVVGLTATKIAVAMAEWGDLLGLQERYGTAGTLVRVDAAGRSASGTVAPLGGTIVNSEVIHLRMPNSRDPYQGYPDWVAATPIIELMQALVRHEFDFHFNRGVPELLATIIGGSITKRDWDENIVPIFRASQGIGNSRKTAALHLSGSPDTVSVQVDKLAAEDREPFGDKAQAMALLIATAHGIPPMLANVSTPGKIGAANESPNALLLVQKRKLGQIQKSVSRTLARTLGSGAPLNQEEGTPKTLKAAQFLGEAYKSGQDENGAPIYHERGNGFKTVLDGMTLGAQQTLASMKEPIAGSSRNPADGLLTGTDQRKPGDPRATR